GKFRRHGRWRGNQGNELVVWRFLVALIRLVADRVSAAALQPMAVVVKDFLERADINHRLFSVETGTLLALVSGDGDRTKCNSSHRAPWLVVSLEDLHSVKAGVGERVQKTFLGQSPRNATAPELGIVLQRFGHSLIGDNVGNHGAPAFL